MALGVTPKESETRGESCAAKPGAGEGESGGGWGHKLGKGEGGEGEGPSGEVRLLVG